MNEPNQPQPRKHSSKQPNLMGLLIFINANHVLDFSSNKTSEGHRTRRSLAFFDREPAKNKRIGKNSRRSAGETGVVMFKLGISRLVVKTIQLLAN